MQYAPGTLASQTGLRRLMSSVGALRMPASGLRSWNKAEPIILSRCAAPCLELCLVRDVRFGPKADISLSVVMSALPPKVDIQSCVPIRIGAGCHKPADIVTCPVLYNPMARAAAGDRSMSLPRTHGPRSLMRTVTHPLWQTRIWVPIGSLRWAAVIAAQFSRSPLAVLWPHSPSLPP